MADDIGANSLKHARQIEPYACASPCWFGRLGVTVNQAEIVPGTSLKLPTTHGHVECTKYLSPGLLTWAENSRKGSGRRQWLLPGPGERTWQRQDDAAA